MKRDFWKKLAKPIYALAPMADVTDVAFRQMFALYGKPDVMFTEFVSTDGLCSPGREHLMRELRYTEIQRPIVAQIWGRNPEHFYESAVFLASLKFDGIDINFGCPQSKEMAQRTCAALIAEPALAAKIIAETKRGAGTLPVSVKTRIGIREIETEKWIGALLSAEPAAITIHARTAREMSASPAHWDEILKAVAMRDRLGSDSLILGNGDIKTLVEADQRIRQSGVDGVMVGRGVFGNPWFFSRSRPIESVPLPERFSVMQEHARLFVSEFGENRSFAVMRKHFKAYCAGFAGARELRLRLMEAPDLAAVKEAIDSFVRETAKVSVIQ